MSSVGQYSILSSPCLMRYVMKKYRMLMCLVRLELERFPLFSKSMEDWLSWYMIVLFIP